MSKPTGQDPVRPTGRHLPALLVPLWVGPVVVAGALNILNWSMAATDLGRLAGTSPSDAFTGALVQPLAFLLLAMGAIPTSALVVLPGLVIGAPLFVLSMRRRWVGLGWFILSGVTVGALAAAVWAVILRWQELALLSFGPGTLLLTATSIGGLSAALMWLHAAAPPGIDRRPWLASLPLLAIVPPALPAIVVLAFLRRRAPLAQHLAWTLAGLVVLLALAYGGNLRKPAVLFGLAPAAILLGLLGALLLNRLQRRQEPDPTDEGG